MAFKPVAKPQPEPVEEEFEEETEEVAEVESEPVQEVRRTISPPQRQQIRLSRSDLRILALAKVEELATIIRALEE
jgi:rRNA maturation endonuclease Nob1